MEAAISSILFYLFAMIAVLSAFGVVASRNPVTSAMCMAVSFASTAAVLFGMGAQFLGIVQIIVYAGAILVLFLFVVMMLDVKNEESNLSSLPRAIVGVVVAGVFAGMVTKAALLLPGAMVIKGASRKADRSRLSASGSFRETASQSSSDRSCSHRRPSATRESSAMTR